MKKSTKTRPKKDAINESSRAYLQQLGGPLLDTAKYNLWFYKYVVFDQRFRKYYLLLGFSGLQQA